MNDTLNKAMVLNRNWQAVNVRTPQEAFCDYPRAGFSSRAMRSSKGG
jgi:hypothetical protein